MKSKKVVITGGAGFIGSHLVEYWINKGTEIHIIDDLRTGHIKNIPQSGLIYFNKGSISDRVLVEKVIQGSELVFNLAAMISVPESLTKPQECVEINVLGLINILEAAKKYDVKKVIHSSSAAVYGDNPASPKEISMKPQPKTPYGITKLDGEYYCQMYYESFGLPTVSLRYFNVFGPRQDPKSHYAAVIPIFVSRAIKNEPIIIYGDGDQTRDFIFVDDIIQANVLAAENKSLNGVFNVANGESISILDLAKIIINIIGSKSKIVFSGERSGDIKHSRASIIETKEKLGFIPKYDLIKGLQQTIAFFLKEM